MRTVAALYVDPRGPYPKLPAVECWDERRDARRYRGPHPVVAHPPCARWCKLAKFVEAAHGTPVGADGGTFGLALAAVRRFGGVLEHPAWSLAWDHFGLTHPLSYRWTRTREGEWVCSVAQAAWGHEARKQTWILLVGAEPPDDTRWEKPRGTKAMTYFSQRHPGDFNRSRSHAERMSSAAVHITPPAFAEWLVGMARRARGTVSSAA